MTFIPGGRLLPLSSDWRVRFVTDGSVSRHSNRKSSPSWRLGLVRGVTNTVEGLVWSGRGHYGKLEVSLKIFEKILDLRDQFCY